VEERGKSRIDPPEERRLPGAIAVLRTDVLVATEVLDPVAVVRAEPLARKRLEARGDLVA
jgi:hypothetical protein